MKKPINITSLGVISSTQQGSTPAAPASGQVAIYPKADGNYYKQTSAGVESLLGSGGSGELNNVANGSGLQGLTGWATSGSLSFSVENPTSFGLNPLIASAFLISGSTVGAYAYYRFQMPVGLKNFKQKIEFFQSTLTNLKLDLYTNTASNYSGTYTRVSLNTDVSAVTNLSSNTGKFTASFDADSSDYYELRLVVTAASVSGRITNIISGPGIQPQGAIVGPAISFTPVFSNSTNISPQFSQYSRIGDKMNLQMRFDFFGAGAGSTFTVAIPAGLTIAASVVPTSSSSSLGTGSINGSLAYAVQVNTFSTTTIFFRRVTATAFSYSGTDFVNGDYVNFNILIPIAEWAGSGTVNLAQNDVEYAYNTNTSDIGSGTDSTSFGYGSYGVVFAANATVASYCQRYVKFQSPIQPTDKIEIQITVDGGTTWVGLDGGLISTFVNQLGVYYGIQLDPVNSNTISALFGTYTQVTGNAYGGAGRTWGGIANNNTYRWRVVKTRAGVAVGFGQVAQGTAGLVKSAGQLLGTNTNDVALTGFVGEIISNSANSFSTPNTVFTTPFGLVLTPGHWVIKAYAYCVGAGTATGAQLGISIDSSTSGFSDIATSGNPLASNVAMTGNLIQQDCGIMINKTVQLSTTTTYYCKVRTVGGTGSGGAMMEATRVR